MGQADYQEECYPASLEAGASGAMRLAPGEESEVDFALTETHPVRLSGNITGTPDGARAAVWLQGAGFPRMRPRITTRVSPDGRFVFPEVPAGSWTVTAAPGNADDRSWFAEASVEVGASDVTGIVLAAEPSLTITGTVRIESESAPGEAGPKVQLSLQPTAQNPGMVNVVFSDDNRSFTITGVTPGNWKLNVVASSYFVKSALLGGRDISHGEFTIDAAPGPMEIVLSDNGGSLEGDVTTDDGSPATSASIILLREGEFVRVFRATNGHFNLQNLQPGAYTVSAWDSTRNVEYANPEWMRQYAGAAAAVTIEAGQDARIKLTRQTAPLE